jgi:DNA gyrase subunit A
VRLGQDFAMRYQLVDGQGNFGSIDGDPPAAYRYTECRMRRSAASCWPTSTKETVDFQPNYDDKETEPTVLPARFPTCWSTAPPASRSAWRPTSRPTTCESHRRRRSPSSRRPDITTDELIEIVPGPDFPTGGFISGRNGIRAAYEHGRGAC